MRVLCLVGLRYLDAYPVFRTMVECLVFRLKAGYSDACWAWY